MEEEGGKAEESGGAKLTEELDETTREEGTKEEV
jgi:hypothetical protein